MKIFIIAAYAALIVSPASAEKIESYADCVKVLAQAMTITDASKGIARDTFQSAVAPSVTDKDGKEIDFKAMYEGVAKANGVLIDALAVTCERLRY